MSDRNIGYLKEEELPLFRDFLEKHWRANHALVASPGLMDWMYRDLRGDHYHFVVARDKTDGSLEAVLGFLPLAHFDAALTSRDLWLQLWKVRDDRRGSGLGTALFQYLKRQWQPRSVCGFGLSEGVKHTYAKLGFTLGMLNHYFLVNPRKTDFRLLNGWTGPAAARPAASVRLVPLDVSLFETWAGRFNWQRASQQVPVKSAGFFRRRYFEHPIYRYEVFALAEGDRPRAFLVLRVAGHDGAFALKWIDYYGDFSAIAATGGLWPELLAHYDAEYVELHNLGIPSGVMAQAGFQRRLPNAPVTVPSYFEPFEQRNVDIAYAHWTWSDHPYCIFKGDSDQDRPTLIPALRLVERPRDLRPC